MSLTAGFGHTAIYIGGTTVVTTQGVDSGQPVDGHPAIPTIFWAQPKDALSQARGASLSV